MTCERFVIQFHGMFVVGRIRCKIMTFSCELFLAFKYVEKDPCLCTIIAPFLASKACLRPNSALHVGNPQLLGTPFLVIKGVFAFKPGFAWSTLPGICMLATCNTWEGPFLASRARLPYIVFK